MFAININKNAPVIAHDQLFINAQPKQVWLILTNINQWPKWQSAIQQAYVEEALAEGVTFEWKAGGLFFTSVIHTCAAHRFFGWTGKTIGAFAVHNWEFIPHNGGTLAKVEESLQGIFPSLFKSAFIRTLEKGMKTQLNELKTAAEKTEVNQ
ncbi:MAG: SRPBCC family protein [Bacteroidia bacterium]|nr:SRPBCC family protein [Bacteroidia bacterium]